MKKTVRPKQEFCDGNVTWFSDDNSIIFKGEFVDLILRTYVLLPNNLSLTEHQKYQEILLEIKGEMDSFKVIDLISSMPLQFKDLFEFFLVKLDLPESVEDILITKYLYFKGENAKLQDRINKKRNKINGFKRPI